MTDNANSNLTTGDHKLSVERAQIIEECAKVADSKLTSIGAGFGWGAWTEPEYALMSNVAADIAKSIRALSASDHQSGPPVDMVPISLLSAERERAEMAEEKADNAEGKLDGRDVFIEKLRSQRDAANARIAVLTEHLRIALRQWAMYAEAVEGRDDPQFDFAKEVSAEADLYRAARKALTEST